MAVSMDSSLSIYDLVCRSRQGSIMLRHRQEMVHLSYRIEENVIEKYHGGSFFAGFQYLSRFKKRQHIYEKLAQSVESVYVFAFPDVPIPQIKNLHIIPLREDDRMMEEWFVMYHGSDYYSALVAREGDNAYSNHQDNRREFHSIWTFNPDIIQIMTDWLGSLMGERPALNARQYDQDALDRSIDEDMDHYLEISED